METAKQAKSVYSLVTERIIEQLEKGIIPWKKTWTEAGQPRNFATHRFYNGINVLLLSSLKYSRNLFLTFRQAVEMGAKIKKGEKGNIIVYSKHLQDLEDHKGMRHRRFILRYYLVFNVAQCEGIKEEQVFSVHTHNHPVERCERIVALMPKAPTIQFVKDHPYYQPKADYINMPRLESFDSSESYYETLFHELTHSTGHSTRLNRPEVMNNHKFGSEMYSREELTAEIGSCFLKSIAGFKECARENNTAYLRSWLKVLRNDSRFIVAASAQAQKAVDYIMNAGNLDDTYSIITS